MVDAFRTTSQFVEKWRPSAGDRPYVLPTNIQLDVALAQAPRERLGLLASLSKAFCAGSSCQLSSWRSTSDCRSVVDRREIKAAYSISGTSIMRLTVVPTKVATWVVMAIQRERSSANVRCVMLASSAAVSRGNDIAARPRSDPSRLRCP